MTENGLFVVATPIGNLEDISARALRILSEVDCVAAEDTRHTRRLLQHFGIKTAMKAVHEHNEEQVIPALLERLAQGGSLALVSDAGTPLISDPGFRLVAAARAAGLKVHVVPGPSAVTAALSVAGLPTNRFVFDGFLPARASARRQYLESLKQESRTLVLFESSHRIEAAMVDLAAVFGGDRQAALCRELTKQFETVLRGTLEDIQEQVSGDPLQRKGEFVIVVAGAPESPTASTREAVILARTLAEYLPASQAARVAAKISGASRRELFKALE